jgi:hypothetical protein
MHMKKVEGKVLLLRSFLVLLAGMVLMFPCMTIATEVEWPSSCFTAEELAKVREWEKTWVGKKIDATNVDQVTDYLLPGAVEWYKEGENWGAPPGEPYFFIAPYKLYTVTDGTIAATKKYAPTTKLTADGEIANYADTAGVPFPHPKTGIEMVWNFDSRPRGDTRQYFQIGPNITPNVSVERTSRADYIRMSWIRRTNVPPVPKFENNPKGIHHGNFMHMYDPPENKNSRYYNIRYTDGSKGDDGYIYYAPFRRLRRMGAAVRTDTIDGTDLIYDDGEQWDGHVQKNTYKYIGKKELLCCRHDTWRNDNWKRRPGQVIHTGIHRERMNMVVVEVVNKDPNYVYGKRIWYMDPESYWIPWQEIYDQLDRYWKVNEYRFNILETKQGKFIMMTIGNSHCDIQRTHGGAAVHTYFDTVEGRKGRGIGLAKMNQKIFTIQYLQKAGY